VGLLRGDKKWIKEQRYEVMTDINALNFSDSQKSSITSSGSDISSSSKSSGYKSVTSALFKKSPRQEREEDAFFSHRTDVYPPVLRLQRIFIRAGDCTRLQLCDIPYVTFLIVFYKLDRH